MDKGTDDVTIIISSSSEQEDVPVNNLLGARTSIETIFISSDDDDDVYFVPRPRSKMISDGDDLPRIRRERRRRNQHPRPCTKVKQEDDRSSRETLANDQRDTSGDDEPPRIPPLPDLSDVLPDIKPDPSPQKHHGRKTPTSKENMDKGENRNPKKCQPIKKKRKSVDFYKSQSNAILGELFSLSDSDSCMVTFWHKQSSCDAHANNFEGRRRNSSECSSGSSVVSTEHSVIPVNSTSSVLIEEKGLNAEGVVRDTFGNGDEQQRKRLKRDNKHLSHQRHLSQTKSLKSLSHKKSQHSLHRKKFQYSRSTSIDPSQKKMSHLHLPKRSASVGSQAASTKAGAFEVLQSLSLSAESSQESDASITIESAKIDENVSGEGSANKQDWSNCSVRLTRLLKVLKFVGKNNLKEQKSKNTENVSKTERHFLDGLPLATDKAEGVLKHCDTDSITVDLISASESNDEELEQKSHPELIMVTDSESLPDISDNEAKGSDLHGKVIVIPIDGSDTCLEQSAPRGDTPDNRCQTFPDETNELNDISKYQEYVDNDTLEEKEESNGGRRGKEIHDRLDVSLNYSLKSNEFSDISEDEGSEDLNNSLKDKQFSDVSEEENVNLDYSFKSEEFSDVSDNEVTSSHCDTAYYAASKDASLKLKETSKYIVKNRDKPARSQCDLSVRLSDINVSNTIESLQEAKVDSPTDMPILEKMSLELFENDVVRVKEIPKLEKEDSISVCKESERTEVETSADASVCDFKNFSKFLYRTSNLGCDENSTVSPDPLSSSPKRLSPPSSSVLSGVSGNLDTLPCITPCKSRKRKVRCRKTRQPSTPCSVTRKPAFLQTCSTSRPSSRLDFQEQTVQLSNYFKEYLLIGEQNPDIGEMADVFKNIITGCDEEDHNITHSIKFLNHFSKKHFIPNDLLIQIMGSFFYSDTCEEKHVYKFSNLVKTVDRKYPGRFCVKWEELARCLDVITSIKQKSEKEYIQASSHLKLLVQLLKNDLFSKDLSDSREIRQTSAYKLLSYDIGSSSKRKELMFYLKRELHAGNTTGIGRAALVGGATSMGGAKDVLRGLQELLSLGVDCSSSCVDCANTLAGELMNTYVYLPQLAEKHVLLDSTCSPLLRYKLLQLILESQYSGTLPLCGFPESLQAIIRCFFRATPLINPLTPPISPAEDQEEVEGHDMFYTPADTEELAMLLYYIVDSYLKCTQEKSYMALRRRSHYHDRDIRDPDREELRRLPDHVMRLERHLRRMTPELTAGTDHYLLLLSCLSDLAEPRLSCIQDGGTKVKLLQRTIDQTRINKQLTAGY